MTDGHNAQREPIRPAAWSSPPSIWRPRPRACLPPWPRRKRWPD